MLPDPASAGTRLGVRLRERVGLVALFLSTPGGPAVAVVMLVMAATPSLMAMLAGSLVTGATASPAAFAAPLAGYAAVLVLGNVAGSIAAAWSNDIARHIDGRSRDRLRAAALTPETLTHLEDPSFTGDMVRASDQTPFQGRQRSPGTAAVGQVALVVSGLGALATAVVLATYAWWLALLVVLGTLATRALTRVQWMSVADSIDAALPAKQRVGYWIRLLTAPADAKEIRLFGLGGWVGRHRSDTELGWMRPVWRARGRLLRQQWMTVGLAGLTAMVALVAIARGGWEGTFGPGAIVACLSAAFAIAGHGQMDYQTYDVVHGLGAVHALDRLERRVRPATPAPATLAAPRETTGPRSVTAATPGISLQHLSYTYPGTSRPVIDDLSLDIAPGEVVAIVGRNGAGKTTLINILTGLRHPDFGAVVIDGAPLGPGSATGLAVADWRRRIAVTLPRLPAVRVERPRQRAAFGTRGRQ